MQVNDIISHNFNRSEFACPCGECECDTVDTQLLEICEIVRDFEGGPVHVNSGHRCAEHNSTVGGGTNSQHLYGRAADLRVKDPKATRGRLDFLYPNSLGLGIYDTFIHVDTRTLGPARWDNRTGRRAG